MVARKEGTSSLWMRVAVASGARPLDRDRTCDVAVVGAGIAGLSTAYELACAGMSVCVLDRGPIAGGISARTTAHLAPVCDDGLRELIKARGEDDARRFQASQAAAVDRIEAIVEAEAIACDYRRLSAYLFPAMGMTPKDAQDFADGELEAARKLGVPAERGQGVPLKGFERAPTLRYPDQATFHPLKYLKGLADAIVARGGVLHPMSAVTAIEAAGSGVTVRTAGGRKVSASYAVVATNAPIVAGRTLHARMTPYRTYALALELPRDALPDALYWDMGDPYHYVRIQPGSGAMHRLIAGGADHRTGEADDGTVRLEAVEAWIRALVPRLGRTLHRWSGQVLDTDDYCAFIGADPDHPRILLATGDSGQGMTHGALAGMLLRDHVLGVGGDWQAVYDPARASGRVAAALHDGLSAAASLAARVMPGDFSAANELAPGEGGLVREGGTLVAICRTRDGRIHRKSPTCSFGAANVRWNSTEQCWDCSAHGCHFAPDGSVLNGPAIAPLSPA